MRAEASPAVVEELYRRHADELRGFLYRRAGPHGIDLLQEVFVVALRRRTDLPAPEMQRAWLFGTARRLLLADQRDARRRRIAETEAASLRDEAIEAADGARLRAVRDALRSLSDKDRELVQLTEWEGLQVSEAASVLGLRAGTARVRLHRARRRLATHPSLRSMVGPPAGEAIRAPHQERRPVTPPNPAYRRAPSASDSG